MITLPTLTTPKYTTKLTTGETVSYRAFLVKEEKLLLIAHQTGDIPTILEAIKDLVVASTFGSVDIRKLTTTDLIWLLIKIRSKSVGEIAKYQTKCNNEACGKDIECGCDLESVVLPDYSSINKKIELTSTIGLLMGLPKTDAFNIIVDPNINKTDKLYAVIISCIESVYDDKEVASVSEIPKEDIIKFVDNLNHQQFSLLKEYYEKLPMIAKTIDTVCPHCQHKNTMVLKGLFDFFV